MEETNVTMTAAEMQGEPAAKENETKAEKFIRIGEYRMNKAVDAIGRLENLANRSSYEYTQEQVDAMFQALEYFFYTFICLRCRYAGVWFGVCFRFYP